MKDKENAGEVYIQQLRKILYPEGVKHPQQGEWEWLLEKVRELASPPANKNAASEVVDILNRVSSHGHIDKIWVGKNY